MELKHQATREKEREREIESARRSCMTIPIECLPLLALHCSSWGLQQRRHKGMRHSSYAIRTVQLGKWLPCCLLGQPPLPNPRRDFSRYVVSPCPRAYIHADVKSVGRHSVQECLDCKGTVEVMEWNRDVDTLCFFQCTRICQWQQNKTLLLAGVRT